MLIALKWLRMLTSNLASMLHDPLKKFRTLGVVRVTWPRKLRALNASGCRMSKGTIVRTSNSHARKESPVMTSEIFFRKGGVPSVTWPRKLWVLNANSSKMTKDTNFKFVRHALGNVPTECLKNYFRKGTWPSSRNLIAWRYVLLATKWLKLP